MIRSHVEVLFTHVPHKSIFLLLNCSKNKARHLKVKFQQTTRSRSYIAHCEALVISCCFTLFTVPYYQIYIDLFEMQRKACKDQKVPEPNSAEIFKDCHTSKKKGMTTPVKAVVVSP